MNDRGIVCGRCGTVNDPAAQFCMQCGALLAAYISPLGAQPQPAPPSEPDAVPEPLAVPQPPPQPHPQPQPHRPSPPGTLPGTAPPAAPDIAPPADSDLAQPIRNAADASGSTGADIDELLTLDEPIAPEPLAPPPAAAPPAGSGERAQSAPPPTPAWPPIPEEPPAQAPATPGPPEPAPEPASPPSAPPGPLPAAGPSPAPPLTPPVTPQWTLGRPPARQSGRAPFPRRDDHPASTPPQTLITIGIALIIGSCVLGTFLPAVDLPFFVSMPLWCLFPIGLIVLVVGIIQLATRRREF